MALEQKDIETIEKIIYKNSDDIAIALSRSFERLEERIDACESRMSARVSDSEDRVESARQDLTDELGDIKSELRQLSRDFAGKAPGDI